MATKSHSSRHFSTGSPDFRCFPEDDCDVSQLSDDDRCSIDGFESDFDALDSDIYVPPRVNYGYPREPYRPSTASQRPTSQERRHGTSSQYRGVYLREDFPRQPTRPFGGMSFHSWAPEDDTDASDSSVTTGYGRFTYGFQYRNRNANARSCMGRGKEPEFDEEDDDSEDSSEWMSTSSASTPKQAPRTNPHHFVDLKTIRAAFHAYESRWAALISKGHAQRLTFKAIPWPQFPTPSSVADINVGNILTFLKLGGTATAKMAVRQALLRFHPDKTAGLLINVEERERESVMAACAAVARCLNEINRTL